MTWVATGVGAAGTIYSGVSAGKAGKAADKSAAQQQALLAQDLAERKRVAARQENIYGGLEQRLVSRANQVGIDPIRAGVIRSRVGTEFDNADRNITRMIGTRGVSSGLGASLLGSSQMNRARALAGGMIGEYQNKDTMGMQLLSRYNPLQNAEFQSQGLRGMASFYGDEAARARAAEQAGWQGVGQGVMGTAMLYASRAPKAAPQAQPGVWTPPEIQSPLRTEMGPANISGPSVAGPAALTTDMGKVNTSSWGVYKPQWAMPMSYKPRFSAGVI
jgi:hypothetical protein